MTSPHPPIPEASPGFDPAHASSASNPPGTSSSGQVSPWGPHPGSPQGHPATPEPPRGRGFFREWVLPLVVLVLALFSFRSAVADWNEVPTGSMKPTILEGDRVVVNKVAYDLKVPFTTVRLAEWANPERGDIVVLKSPENGRRLIKRIIGLPGDELALVGNRLFINGQPALYEPIDPEIAGRLDERELPYRAIAWEELGEERHPVMTIPSLRSVRGNFGPVSVPPDQFFLMGDNRDESRDSRVIGFVPRELILGKAVAVAFSREDTLTFRSDRFFEALE